MAGLIERALSLSPGRILEFLSNPWKIGLRLNTPVESTCERAICSLFPEATAEEAERLRLNFLSMGQLSEGMNAAMAKMRGRRVNWMAWNDFLYVAMRILKPETVIETGVFDGQSSAIILQAMADNGAGRLVSIDYPARESVSGSTHQMRESFLPPGKDPGWLIPDRLRKRHELHLGDSREILPERLKEIGGIDVFFHDSMHTFDHQMFEYETAWPSIREGGLLLSDDILWSAAYYKFCRRQGRRFVRIGGFGAARK